MKERPQPGIAESPNLGDLQDSRRQFRVLITSSYFEPGFRGGGAIRSLVQILEGLSRHVDAILVTQDRDLGVRTPYPGLSGRCVERSGARVFYFNARRLGQWMRLRRTLGPTPFDVLYVNSVWSQFSIVPILAVRLRVIKARKILLAPRGEFSPGAISLKAAKKKFFLSIWRHVLQGLPIVWNPTTEQEAGHIRVHFPDAEVAIGGADFIRSAVPASPISTAESHGGPVRLVFIGRISEKKNLRLVLEALSQVRRHVEFDIYGPIEDVAYWQKCKRLVNKMPRNVSVAYCGEIQPENVRRTFANYDAFVFPTLGENFGHVILESLSAGCPVICSNETPWSSILESGGGVVLPELSAAALAARIEVVAGMSTRERRQAKESAGRCYMAWRSDCSELNILDRLRLAEIPNPGGSGVRSAINGTMEGRG
ncbi:glycosyltransferase family 4 protein [Actinopolymorpha sp. B11F2]|uniref:glycosyltransferase family 4 protein n=1 Tax=Actinopolymorpha sp. B11F2 TaxID=3160862 RepID=UPI0032E51431